MVHTVREIWDFRDT